MHLTNIFRCGRAWMFLALGGAALSGCKGKFCPADMKETIDVPERAVWCRSPDGVHARWIEFHPGGKLHRQDCSYVSGAADGPYRGWHASGPTSLEGRYGNGMRIGKWSQFDDRSNCVAEAEYRDGQLVMGVPVGAAATCDTHKP